MNHDKNYTEEAFKMAKDEMDSLQAGKKSCAILTIVLEIIIVCHILTMTSGCRLRF